MGNLQGLDMGDLINLLAGVEDFRILITYAFFANSLAKRAKKGRKRRKFYLLKSLALLFLWDKFPGPIDVSYTEENGKSRLTFCYYNESGVIKGLHIPYWAIRKASILLDERGIEIDLKAKMSSLQEVPS